VVIEVADSGAGFPAEELDYLITQRNRPLRGKLAGSETMAGQPCASMDFAVNVKDAPS
jgi:hypothetical protein